MYLPLTLICLSTINLVTSLPVPENDPAATIESITPRTPTTPSQFLEKRQPVYAPVETNKPVVKFLTGSSANVVEAPANVLEGRGTGAPDGFDNLLCASLKALKGQFPGIYTSLLQSCTAMIDSSPHKRTTSLKERTLIDEGRDLTVGSEATEDVHSGALLRRSETDLLEKRGPEINSVAGKR